MFPWGIEFNIFSFSSFSNPLNTEETIIRTATPKDTEPKDNLETKDKNPSFLELKYLRAIKKGRFCLNRFYLRAFFLADSNILPL